MGWRILGGFELHLACCAWYKPLELLSVQLFAEGGGTQRIGVNLGAGSK